MKIPTSLDGWLAQRSLRRSVPWIGALFIAAIVGFAALDIVRGYRATVAQTGSELDTQARTIAEQTARTLQAVDVVLRHIQDQYRQGVVDAMEPAALHAYLRDQAVGLVQIDGLVLVRADGIARANSLRHPLPEGVPSAANVDVFQAAREDMTGKLLVGNVTISAIDRAVVFPMARRLETADGRFAGAVGARGRVDYFQQFYRDVQGEPSTKISLLRRDGMLLARQPSADASLGKRLPLSDELLAAQAGGAGPVRTVSPIDGVERFGSLQAVPDYPLVVAITRDVSAALAPWREEAISSAVRTLALAGLAAALLALATRQLRRIDTTRRSLEAARERFALAVSGADVGIWDWDHASNRMFGSPRTRELLGMQPGPDSEPARDWFNQIHCHPDDEAIRWSALDDHLAGKTPAYEEEYRVLHPDGVYRWVRVRGVCVRDGAGGAVRMAGSVSDVDARRRAEEGLRQSEERFALAVAGSKDGVSDWDIVNDRMFTSPRAMEICGIQSDLTVRTRAEWLALLQLHPDDAQRYTDDLDRHFRGEVDVRDGEYRVRQPDGEYRWVRIRGKSVRDAEGRAIRWAGSSSDIDAQKRVEQALRQSEERYQLAVAGSNEGLWDWDLRRDMLFLSPRAQTLLGREPGEPLRPRREWINSGQYHPDDEAAMRQALSQHLRGLTPHFSCEYRIRHTSGEWHWYRQRGVAVRDARGRAYRVAGSMEDVTDRRTAEADRDRFEAQLRQAQKLEAIGTLAGGIAHDFNNILAAILGYGEMAQKEAVPGTAQQRHIDAAMSAAMRAKSLVERILAFSRSGVGERVPVHVQTIVAEALEVVSASLPSGMVLEHHIDVGDAAVMGDPTQLHQVVVNLCANAAQAMRSTGTLRVGVSTIELAQPLAVTTSILTSGKYVRLVVEDSGAGIAPGVLERIFDPFFTTREVGVGTGLGLSLVHGIVTDLGGGIEVQSLVGHGTTMTVFVPWQRTVAAPASAPQELPSGAGETVLLVDDEESLVRLGEEMMADLGYEPVGFASSTAALASFRATPHRFQAVLSDEAMPEMTGSELARELRRIRPDIPILLMSGYVTPALTTRAREIGVRDVLAKPLVAGDIACSLAKALHG
ncbi:PAS domain-containing protein [Variovorax sp. J22R133]|uniref:PAS domain-containing protein n=1 Tax=Variovorax brevis TaxID=3053503 RepID=UPI002575E1E2|nr:PAS domain-containing protein [Variovorax sp. J22R133]MDM0113994.1 PAS domain-containing protein [Variovorax sp. J22R133]